MESYALQNPFKKEGAVQLWGSVVSKQLQLSTLSGPT